MIEPEPPDTIQVAAGGKLVVPREDLDIDFDDGTELDLADALPKKDRKPNRREWIVLNRDSEFTTHMLFHRPKADGIEEVSYYVDKALRGPIRDELRSVRVFVYFSLKLKSHGLWVVKVTPDNSWYESLRVLFSQPAEFFVRNAIRVMSDKPNARYRIKHKPLPTDVTWPSKSTNELLGEAIGRDRFITAPDHPIYRELVEGVELG